MKYEYKTIFEVETKDFGVSIEQGPLWSDEDSMDRGDEPCIPDGFIVDGYSGEQSFGCIEHAVEHLMEGFKDNGVPCGPRTKIGKTLAAVRK